MTISTNTIKAFIRSKQVVNIQLYDGTVIPTVIITQLFYHPKTIVYRVVNTTITVSRILKDIAYITEQGLHPLIRTFGDDTKCL